MEALDRFAYANNNPVLYNDPSGHFFGIDDLIEIGTAVVIAAVVVEEADPELPEQISDAANSPEAQAVEAEGVQLLSESPVIKDAGNEIGQAAQTVYRGLAEGEDPTNGLIARAVDAGNSAASHVAGKIDSQWISTTKDIGTAIDKFGENGVVEIDLSKVTTQVLDVSHGIPGIEGSMISNWAQKFQEVLVQNYIPAEAIVRYISGAK